MYIAINELVTYIGIFLLISFHILHEPICKFSNCCTLLSQSFIDGHLRLLLAQSLSDLCQILVRCCRYWEEGIDDKDPKSSYTSIKILSDTTLHSKLKICTNFQFVKGIHFGIHVRL